jgi:hypothetical protein
MRTSRDATAAKRDSRADGRPEGSFYTWQTLIARDGGEETEKDGWKWENALTGPETTHGDFALEIFDNVCGERENRRRQIR